MIIYICPECGGDLVDYVITTYPPIQAKKCLRCGWRWESQTTPMTNADRIRGMSDEKLTEFLLRRDLEAAKKLAEAAGFSITYDEQKCKEYILAWLKSPVEVEE